MSHAIPRRRRLRFECEGVTYVAHMSPDGLRVHKLRGRKAKDLLVPWPALLEVAKHHAPAKPRQEDPRQEDPRQVEMFPEVCA